MSETQELQNKLNTLSGDQAAEGFGEPKETVVLETQVVEETNEEEEKKKKRRKKQEVEENEVKEVVEDRSAFNCPDCKGEGMIFNDIFPEGKSCTLCKATGKI